MDKNFTIENAAVHYVDPKKKRVDLAKDQFNLEELDPIVITFLQRIIMDTLQEEEMGSVYSANFTEEGRAVTKNRIERILDSPESFFDTTIDLARNLYSVSPGNASTGLVAFFRIREDDGKNRVVILKIPNKDESFVKLRENEFTQITVEDIDNLLVDNIQKAAVIPHPYKKSFDLKVIDKQVRADPATYFSLKFLGSEIRKSDEYQITKTLPTIRAYAESRNFEFDNTKLPEIISKLKLPGKDVTTSFIARVVSETDVFGPGLDVDDFVKYINEESLTGPIHVRAQDFQWRRNRDRLLKVTFKAPPFEDLTMIGPENLIIAISSQQGQMTNFLISAPTGSIKYEYGETAP